MTQQNKPLSVKYLRVDSLKPHPRNARVHSKRQIRQIADSIQKFGFTNPILIQGDGTIIAGHGRVLAATFLDIQTVPTVCLETLTPDQTRAYVIADNRLTEKAGWDDSVLAVEFGYLLTIDGFDITATGFEVPEVDLILQAGVAEPPEPEEPEVELRGPALARLGDVWELGEHRILCGTSLRESSFATLMGKNRAQVVFTDPPYNVEIDGNAANIGGKSSIRYREFSMAAGEMSQVEFVAFLTNAIRLLNRFSTPESIHFLCMDWRHMGDLLSAAKMVYQELLNLCIWVKSSGGMGSFYRSRHELIFAFKNGKGRHQNNVQLGKYGRNRTNVWEYPNVNKASKATNEDGLFALHPTVKPVQLIADALLDCSARDDVVLDAFLGSGSTLIAAERTGRICFGIEIDPLYVDMSVRRWQRYTGERAIHAATRVYFDDLETAGGLNG